MRWPGRSGTRRKTGKLALEVQVDPALGRTIVTDSKRCSRCSRTCCRTPSSSPSRAACACVSSAAARLEPGSSGAQARGQGRGVRGVRHRHRHSAGETEDHLRGVPAGRRQHQPQVRRHRPRPGHQPRAGQPAGRRDPAAQHARRGQHVHAVPARRRTSVPASGAKPADDARSNAQARRSRRCGWPSGRSSRSRTTGTTIEAGRCHAADRRGRSALRAHPPGPGARQGLQGAGGVRAAPKRSRWRASSSRRRSRSTCSCRTCWAGRCSTSSSRIR